MEETIVFPDSNSGESASNSGDSGGRPKGKAFPIRKNDKVTRLRVCVSAQDLTSFMMEEKIKGTGEECSPRAVLEDCIRSSESETSNSKASTSSPEAPATPCVSSHWQRLFRLWRPRSMRRLATFPPLGVPKPPKRHTRSVREGQGSTEHFLDDAQYFCFKPSWKNFTLAEIRAATNNFSSGPFICLARPCLCHGIKIKTIKPYTFNMGAYHMGSNTSEALMYLFTVGPTFIWTKIHSVHKMQNHQKSQTNALKGKT